MAVRMLNLSLFIMNDKFRSTVSAYFASYIHRVDFLIKMSDWTFNICEFNIPSSCFGVWNYMMLFFGDNQISPCYQAQNF